MFMSTDRFQLAYFYYFSVSHFLTLNRPLSATRFIAQIIQKPAKTRVNN